MVSKDTHTHTQHTRWGQWMLAGTLVLWVIWINLVIVPTRLREQTGTNSTCKL